MTQLIDPRLALLNSIPMHMPQLLSPSHWAELRIFAAVAQSKSFNKAADMLGISHPTVSRQIKRLQDVIGAQLLISSKSGVVLTDRGKELADAVLEFDGRIAQISRALSAETRSAEGCVRVSSGEGLAGIFIVPHLREFKERFPAIQIHIKNPVNLLDFRENNADIALVFVPALEKGTESRSIGCLHLIAVASEQYVAERGMPSPENLEGHQFLDMAYYLANTETWASWRRVVNRGTVALWCDNSFAYVFMVKSGLGIGLLGNYMLSDPHIVHLPIDVHVKLPLHLQVATERLNCRPVRIVYDWITEVLTFGNRWFNPNPYPDQQSQGPLAPTLQRYFA